MKAHSIAISLARILHFSRTSPCEFLNKQKIMGKFNKKLNKKNKPLQLEIVPKEQETEVQLKEVRKSDDVIPKKVT